MPSAPSAPFVPAGPATPLSPLQSKALKKVSPLISSAASLTPFPLVSQQLIPSVPATPELEIRLDGVLKRANLL